MDTTSTAIGNSLLSATRKDARVAGVTVGTLTGSKIDGDWYCIYEMDKGTKRNRDMREVAAGTLGEAKAKFIEMLIEYNQYGEPVGPSQYFYRMEAQRNAVKRGPVECQDCGGHGTHPNTETGELATGHTCTTCDGKGLR